MRIRTFALGGAAALALAGLVGTTPALARTSHPATPEEMQQTDALNAQALANAQGQPAASAMPLTTAASTPAQAAAMPAPEAEASAASTGATPLNALSPMPSLANATVQGANGNTIGKVKDVIDGTDGKPSIVDVALNDNSKVVAISAGELSFDTAHNVLIASLTDEEIKSLPPANG